MPSSNGYSTMLYTKTGGCTVGKYRKQDAFELDWMQILTWSSISFVHVVTPNKKLWSSVQVSQVVNSGTQIAETHAMRIVAVIAFSCVPAKDGTGVRSVCISGYGRDWWRQSSNDGEGNCKLEGDAHCVWYGINKSWKIQLSRRTHGFYMLMNHVRSSYVAISRYFRRNLSVHRNPVKRMS